MEKDDNRKILLVLFVGVLIGALDISFVGPAIPSIEKVLQIDEKSKSWIFSIYILFNLAGMSLLARLSDMKGRRVIYVFSVGVFGVGSLIAAFAHSIEVLLIGRAVQGFGASGIFPTASATIGDIYPVEKRGRVLGMIGMVFGLAFLIGPLVAGVLLTYFEWNVLFFINIPICIGLMIFGWRLLPNKKISGIIKIDWLGILLLTLFLTTFTIGINNVNANDIWLSLESKHVVSFLVTSLFALVFFILRENSISYPIIKPAMFASKQIRIVAFLAFGTGLYQISFVFIPDMTVKAFGVSDHIASFMLLPVVFMLAVGSPISGRLIDRYGSKLIINFAFVLMITGLIILSQLKNSYYVYYTSGIFLGLGLSVLAGSSLRYIMLNEVSAQDRALAQGVLTIIISLGQLIGSAMVGAISSSFKTGIKGYNYSFLFLAFISILLFISSLRLKKREQEVAVK